MAHTNDKYLGEVKYVCKCVECAKARNARTLSSNAGRKTQKEIDDEKLDQARADSLEGGE